MPSFRPRQTAYLRISATQVIQMVLYIEEYNLTWMSDEVLERMLMALKDKIPIKVRTEGLMLPKSHKGDAGARNGKVDVYRGSDYQIAYYFRKDVQQHAVLLKVRIFDCPSFILANIDKHLTHAAADFPAPAPKPEPKPDILPPAVLLEPEIESRKRARDDGGEVLDLTDDVAGGDDEGRDGKRPKTVDEPLFIKDEDEDEVIPPGEWAEGDDDKPDLKPQLRVSYTGYSIYSRPLVVVIEPYPPLPMSLRATPSLSNTRPEVRQLSASVAPERARPSPVPANSRRGGGKPALFFRSESTPMDEAERSEVASAFGGDELDEDELPSIDEVLRRRRGGKQQ